MWTGNPHQFKNGQPCVHSLRPTAAPFRFRTRPIRQCQGGWAMLTCGRRSSNDRRKTRFEDRPAFRVRYRSCKKLVVTQNVPVAVRRIQAVPWSNRECRSRYNDPGSCSNLNNAPQARQRELETQFGLGRPPISLELNGYRFVAVGSELHWSKSWKPSPTF